MESYADAVKPGMKNVVATCKSWAYNADEVQIKSIGGPEMWDMHSELFNLMKHTNTG